MSKYKIIWTDPTLTRWQKIKGVICHFFRGIGDWIIYKN